MARHTGLEVRLIKVFLPVLQMSSLSALSVLKFWPPVMKQSGREAGNSSTHERRIQVTAKGCPKDDMLAENRYLFKFPKHQPIESQHRRTSHRSQPPGGASSSFPAH